MLFPICCAAYNCSNSSRNSPETPLFTLPKNEYTSKAWIASLNQQEGISVQSQHGSKLLCYFAHLKHRECKAWWEHWLELIQLLSYCNLARGGSRTSAVSRMKFFVTTVSSWESLAVVTEKQISVFSGVLDSPLSLKLKWANQISTKSVEENFTK